MAGAERRDKFLPRRERFLDGFRASRVVISRMHAVLIDGRSGTQNSERIEKFHAVAALGEPHRDRRPVNSSPRNGNPGAHFLSKDFIWLSFRNFSGPIIRNQV